MVAISLDTKTELWRHERPRVATLGGPPPKPVYTDIGDPVASGIAVANGVVYFTTVASGKLVALDAATGSLLKEIDLGPVWAGPSVSRGRVYIGTGNTLFSPGEHRGLLPQEIDRRALLVRCARGRRGQSDGSGHGIAAPPFCVSAEFAKYGKSK